MAEELDPVTGKKRVAAAPIATPPAAAAPVVTAPIATPTTVTPESIKAYADYNANPQKQAVGAVAKPTVTPEAISAFADYNAANKTTSPAIVKPELNVVATPPVAESNFKSPDLPNVEKTGLVGAATNIATLSPRVIGEGIGQGVAAAQTAIETPGVQKLLFGTDGMKPSAAAQIAAPTTGMITPVSVPATSAQIATETEKATKEAGKAGAVAPVVTEPAVSQFKVGSGRDVFKGKDASGQTYYGDRPESPNITAEPQRVAAPTAQPTATPSQVSANTNASGSSGIGDAKYTPPPLDANGKYIDIPTVAPKGGVSTGFQNMPIEAAPEAPIARPTLNNAPQSVGYSPEQIQGLIATATNANGDAARGVGGYRAWHGAQKALSDIIHADTAAKGQNITSRGQDIGYAESGNTLDQRAAENKANLGQRKAESAIGATQFAQTKAQHDKQFEQTQELAKQRLAMESKPRAEKLISEDIIDPKTGEATGAKRLVGEQSGIPIEETRAQQKAQAAQMDAIQKGKQSNDPEIVKKAIAAEQELLKGSK